MNTTHTTSVTSLMKRLGRIQWQAKRSTTVDVSGASRGPNAARPEKLHRDGRLGQYSERVSRSGRARHDRDLPLHSFKLT